MSATQEYKDDKCTVLGWFQVVYLFIEPIGEIYAAVRIALVFSLNLLGPEYRRLILSSFLPTQSLQPAYIHLRLQKSQQNDKRHRELATNFKL